MTDLQFIGGKILSAADLEAMNMAEIKNRKYKFCTIVCMDGSRFEAKVAYNEKSQAWEPTHVMLDGNWASIDFFENTDPAGSYACEGYRETF